MPRRLEPALRAPIIEAVEVSGTRVQGQTVKVDTETAPVDIHVATPISRYASQLRLRVRLEGVEPGWRQVDGTRHVRYERVPPGHYRVLVQSSWNDDGSGPGAEGRVECPT